MTHEHPSVDEARGGPEHSTELPDATSIPETTDVEASLAPPMHDTGEHFAAQTFGGAEPGWWERPDPAAQIPRWAGTELNEG